jgi:hypothetical protein
MAVTRRTGFPVTPQGATSKTTIQITTIAAGDLVVVGGRVLASRTVTNVTGSGITGWHKVADQLDSTNYRYAWMWAGIVQTPGTITVTVTYSSLPNADCVIAADSWAGNGAGTTWDEVGDSNTFSISSSAYVNLPTLTGATAGVYCGFIRSVRAEMDAGNTAGFSWAGIMSLSGDTSMQWVTDPNCSGGVAYTPNVYIPCSLPTPGNSVAGIFSPSSTPTDVTVTAAGGSATATGGDATASITGSAATCPVGRSLYAPYEIPSGAGIANSLSCRYSIQAAGEVRAATDFTVTTTFTATNSVERSAAIDFTVTTTLNVIPEAPWMPSSVNHPLGGAMRVPIRGGRVIQHARGGRIRG